MGFTLCVFAEADAWGLGLSCAKTGGLVPFVFGFLYSFAGGGVTLVSDSLDTTTSPPGEVLHCTVTAWCLFCTADPQLSSHWGCSLCGLFSGGGVVLPHLR